MNINQATQKSQSSFLSMFKQQVKYLGFNDFWFMTIGIVVLGFIIPPLFFDVSLFRQGFTFEWIEASMFATCYWIVSRLIMIQLRKRYPDFEQVKKRLISSFIWCTLGVTITGIIISPVIIGMAQYFNLGTYKPNALQGFGAAFTATFFLLAVYESIWYYSQLKKSIQEQEQEKVAHIQSQLDGLRNQVNPHFLFNSLNTLNHIVEFEDKAIAKNFINQLSKVYRYILDSREESTITLEEELEFVEAYIAIQKERFLENLNVNITVPKHLLTKKIIPLSLQLLIENAIKHNVISSKKPLKIDIGIDPSTNCIFVKNNIQKKNRVLHSTKVGLQNIKERYRLLASEIPVHISEDHTAFIVSLPLLNQ